jgi:transposase
LPGTGAPWRDLPRQLGNWNTVFKRSLWVKHDVFWAQLDVFNRIFDAVSDDPDIEYAVIDGTIFKVHCRGQGAKGKS